MKFTQTDLLQAFTELLSRKLHDAGITVEYRDEECKKHEGAHSSVQFTIGDDMPDLTPVVDRMFEKIKGRKHLVLCKMLMPHGCDWCGEYRVGNVVVRMVRQYDINENRCPIRFDIRFWL